MKYALAICFLLCDIGVACAAFGIFMTYSGTSCGGGGFLVTEVAGCNDILTTGGGDPLTP